MNGSVYYLWLQLSRGVTRPRRMCSTISANSASSIDRSAQLASDLGSGRQATGRLKAIPIAGCTCVIDRAVSSKKP